jgi:multicomponent Na+:H+ antiporter subunit E
VSAVARIALLVVVWLALWSDLSWANVLSGIAVGTAVVLVFRNPRRGTIAVRPVRAAHFVGFFLVKLAQSSVTVARTVLAPHDRVHTGIVAVPLSGCSDALATLIADAISLTPGTLTLEVRREPLTLFVHALDVRRLDQVEADVRRLEVLAVRAFGDRAAIAGLATDDATTWRGA